MTADDDVLERLERHLGRLLVTGVTASAACLIAGLGLLFLAPASPWPNRLLQSGLVILMGTPMLRVIVSFVEYVRIREWFFVCATLVVFAELAAGIVYAWHR